MPKSKQNESKPNKIYQKVSVTNRTGVAVPATATGTKKVNEKWKTMLPKIKICIDKGVTLCGPFMRQIKNRMDFYSCAY